MRFLADAAEEVARAGVLAACRAIGHCRVWTQPPESSGSVTDSQMGMCGSFMGGAKRQFPGNPKVAERMSAIATPPLAYASGYDVLPSICPTSGLRWNSVTTIIRHHSTASIGPVLTTVSILPPS